MTTEALLETVLNYPFITDYFAYNNYLEAADVFIKDFNGFKELVDRQNITEVLLDAYEMAELTSDNIIFNADLENVDGNDFFKVSTIEFLIAYDQLENGNYSSIEAERFEDIFLQKTQEREENSLYSSASDTYLNFMVQENPIKTKAAENSQTTTVKTPKGTSITAYIYSPDFSSSEKSSINSTYDKAYPSAQRQRSATVKYNCHSYAWYSQATTNKYWIPNASKYTTDGSYSRYSASLMPSVGMKVYYGSGAHSAIVNNALSATNLKFISKWGQAGLYIHDRYFSPYDATTLAYYR